MGFGFLGEKTVGDFSFMLLFLGMFSDPKESSSFFSPAASSSLESEEEELEGAIATGKVTVSLLSLLSLLSCAVDWPALK